MTVSVQAFEGEMWDTGRDIKAAPGGVGSTECQGPNRLVRSRLMASVAQPAPPRKTNAILECVCSVDHIARVIDRTDFGPDCWTWRLRPNAHGYGVFYHNKVAYQAHRAVYELATGESVASDLDMDHLCRNRMCVNPDHLEPVTPAINSHRAATIKWDGHIKVHGTRTRYVSDKCRCVECCEANRLYRAQVRAQKRAGVA